MADNASGFVDFEAFRGLNQDSEDKLMQEAIARAEAADAAAQGSLRKVSREAEGGYGPGGSFRDVQSDLTKVGSYSDYLKAKQNAANAWAAVSQSTGDPRTDALRGGRGAQAAEMGRQSRQELSGREARLGALAADSFREKADSRNRQSAWEAAQEFAKSERQRKDDAFMAQHRAGLDAKMRTAWEKRDRQQGTFGFDPNTQFTIFGENFRAAGTQEEQDDLARMARYAGLNDQADKFQSTATYEWGKRTKGGY